MRKILSIFLFIELLFVSAGPVFASDTEYVSRGSFWNWIAGNGGVVQKITGYFPGSGSCPNSEDTYHHATSYQKEGNLDGDVRYRCICDYCHQPFTAYESDLQQSYDTQVQELPAQGFTSEGNLIWSPSLSDSVDSSFKMPNSWYDYYDFSVPADVSTFTYTERSPFISYEKLTDHSARVYGSCDSSRLISRSGFCRINWTLPFDCSYKRISSPYVDLTYRDSSGAVHSGSSFYKAHSSYSHGTSR